MTITKMIEEVEGEEKKKEVRDLREIEASGAIIKTWGTGTGKSTMTLHVRKSFYKKLGWDIGDVVYMEADFDKKTLTIKKVDMSKFAINKKK